MAWSEKKEFKHFAESEDISVFLELQDFCFKYREYSAYSLNLKFPCDLKEDKVESRDSTPSQSMLMLETISISLNFWLKINPVGSCYCVVMVSNNSWI